MQSKMALRILVTYFDHIFVDLAVKLFDVPFCIFQKYAVSNTQICQPR